MSLFTPQGALVSAAVAVGFISLSLSSIRTSRGAGHEEGAVASGCYVSAPSEVEAGRYLTLVAGCHDCHTPGYMQHGPRVPEETWLTGTPVGWRGPWGTTYPSNLRRFAAETPLDVWLTVCRERTTRPPMPWDNLHAMSDADLTAIHAYLRHLGPVGEPAPAYCDPGVEPAGPFFLLDPDELLHRPVYAAAPLASCGAGEAATFDVMGIAIRALVPSCDSRDAYTLLEQTVPPLAGTDRHLLRRQDKVIHVLEGALEIQLAGEVIQAGPGYRAVIPKATPHAFRNTGESPSRIHVIVSPGGHDEFLRELSELGPDADPGDFDALCETHGVEVVRG